MIERPFGTELQWHEFTVFFGNRNSQLPTLQEAFPHLNFLRLKQVHGDVIFEAQPGFQDASCQGDGLISSSSGLALCSITADCVPVLMASPGTGWLGAFHAGWRGVAARLIPKGIQTLLRKHENPEKLRVWIGPHILQDSFEVQTDVRDLILGSLPPKDLKRETPVEQWGSGPAPSGSASLYYYEDGPGRFRVSLVQVLLEQIAAMGVPLENVEMELDDTKTNEQFHSARRDREHSGRQISWIAKA